MERMSFREKIELMNRYIEQTGNEITLYTQFEGHSIGMWKHNFRSDFLRGKLKIPEELLEITEKMEISIPRKRAERKNDREKYNFINSSSSDKISKSMKHDLQMKHNKQRLNLNEDEILELKMRGIIRLSPLEIKQGAEEYNTSESNIKYVFNNFGDIDDFIQDYKNGQITKVLSISLNFRGIVISKNPISMRKKNAYIRLYKEICSKIDIKDENCCIDIDEIDEILNGFSQIEKEILIRKFGLNGNKPETLIRISKDYEFGAERVRQLVARSLRKLASQNRKNRISNLQEKVEKFLLEKKQLLDGKNSEMESNESIAVLEFSNLVERSLILAGYDKVKDIMNLSRDDLMKIENIGITKAGQIIRKVREYLDDNYQGAKKQKRMEYIDSKIDELNQRISSKKVAYQKAYTYYINEENIFNEDITLPAFKEESLNELKLKKKEKEEMLEKLEKISEEQDKKMEVLQDVIEKIDKDNEKGEIDV